MKPWLLAVGLAMMAMVGTARAETLIVNSTGCPQSNLPCLERQEIVRKGDGYKIISSTKGTPCEIGGHQWVWQHSTWGFVAHEVYGGMKCSVCGKEREIKKIGHKREVTDIEERWADDDQPVVRPKSESGIQFMSVPN